MRPLIDEGHLYVAVPPLYQIKYKKTKHYVYTDNEKEKIFEEIIKKYNLIKSDSIKVQRYKGLGEMNPDELYETTMNRDSRVLKKIIYENYLETDIIFSKLMGIDSLPRKKFIIENYDEVNVLDI